MKKLITTLTMFTVMAVMIPFLSTSASAQTRYYRNRSYSTTTYRRPSFYRRHRNVINVGIATGAGALIGGKKGALIGTLAGAGGGALYTYKIKPKQPRYYYNY